MDRATIHIASDAYPWLGQNEVKCIARKDLAGLLHRSVVVGLFSERVYRKKSAETLVVPHYGRTDEMRDRPWRKIPLEKSQHCRFFGPVVFKGYHANL